MQVVFKSLAISLPQIFCLLISSVAQQVGRIESMKLITPNIGWAATDKKLFWTTNGGSSWEDITPKSKVNGKISSAFFLDSSKGWMLLAAGNERKNEPTLELASTDTAGSSWSIFRVTVPKLNAESTTLTGEGRVDFVDSAHGWLELGVASSSNFRLGILLFTNDGGRTWNWPAQDPGVFGRIHFNSAKTGWLAGGPGDEKLYSTHDGSATWQKVSLPAPPEAGKAIHPTYDQPPTFSNNGEGFLSVTFSGPGGTPSELVLFKSGDEGRTWKIDRVLVSRQPTSPGQVFPSAVAGSVWITAEVSGSVAALTTVASGAIERSPKMDVSVPDSSFLALSFTDGQRGWVLSNGRLLSTSDSGRTWSDVSPASTAPRGQSRGSHSASQLLIRPSSSLVTVQPSSSPGQSAHIGFHKCDAASAGQMGTWMTSSPFYDAGIYIGGASRSCSNSQLIASWVTSVEGQGWGLMPLWPGPQAPCACQKIVNGQCIAFPHVFSATPSVAQTQGVAEANSAIAAASALGLVGLVYYDMEQYSSTQCGAAVTAFVDGWVSQLHSGGYTAGVYGAAADAHADWTRSSHLPDAIWIAKFLKGGAPSVTIWGLGPLVDTEWGTPSAARVHQFLGNYAETWGGAPFTVDVDIEDGPVLNANNGAKIYSSLHYADLRLHRRHIYLCPLGLTTSGVPA